MKTKRLFTSQGMTLIELLIAMTISIVMVLGISLIVQNTMENYIGSREKAQAQMRSRLSIDFIAQELRNSGYLLSWDSSPAVPPFSVNQPITGATVDANTESITIRYARGPLTSTLTAAAPAGTTTLGVTALTVAIPENSFIVLYSPPSTVDIIPVATARSVGDTTILLSNAPSVAFNIGDFVAPVVENAFWVQGGQLMMRSGGVNQRVSSNVEDLQIALIDKNQNVTGDTSSATFAGMSNAQILDIRAVRLSMTGRSDQILKGKMKSVPPSLEDHDRSGEPADQFSRKIHQTTTFLRNLGALD